MSQDLGGVDRLTTLDPAPVHYETTVPTKFRSLVGYAAHTDSYKSSSGLSTNHGQGADSFALESLYTVPVPWDQHGYSITWFNNSVGYELIYGYPWNGQRRTSLGLPGYNLSWLGFLYTASDSHARMACWDMRQGSRYDPAQGWGYASAIPARSFAELMDHLTRCTELGISLDQPTSGTVLHTGHSFTVQVTINNYADNQKVWWPLILLRQAHSYVQLWLADASGTPIAALNNPALQMGGYGLQVAPQGSLPLALDVALPKVSSGSYRLLAQIVFGSSDGLSPYDMYTPNNSISIPIQVVQDQPTPPVDPHIPGPLPGQPQPPAGAATGGGSVDIFRSFDPNEKTGSTGLGPQRLSAFSQRLVYTIYFENQASAAAPAQEIFVTDKLDPAMDWSSLQLEEISIGGRSLALSSVTSPYADQFDLPDYRPTVTRTWQLDLSAQVNLVSGQASWILRSLDPLTGDLPADPQAGLLPPNDLSGRGEGHITYSILPRAGVVPGTLVTNTASIVFDVNPAILTNPVTNTLTRLADLSLGIQAGSANPHLGETLNYTLTLTNLHWDPSGPVTVEPHPAARSQPGFAHPQPGRLHARLPPRLPPGQPGPRRPIQPARGPAPGRPRPRPADRLRPRPRLHRPQHARQLRPGRPARHRTAHLPADYNGEEINS